MFDVKVFFFEMCLLYGSNKQCMFVHVFYYPCLVCFQGEEEGKNVYALSGIEWGAYNDAENAKKR